ncbi:MAG TPA: hypothetical protein VNI54_04860 [Thermoanaerobaculia bacterium]|nr:hypothetical protein [Thermoanaerobaculia bacterium]
MTASLDNAVRRAIHWMVILAAFCIHAPTVLAAPATEARHFILLLDDSGDSPLRPRPYRTPAADVAAALFRPIDGGSSFQPDRDVLTVAFFQIPYKHDKGCFSDRPLSSLTPRGMFDSVVPDRRSIADVRAFAGFLSAQLTNPCRFPKHSYSPIGLALQIVVAFAQDQRSQTGEAPFVSKVYVLRASNDRVNPLGDDVTQLLDRDKGQKLANDVAEQFAFVQLDRTSGSDPELQIVRFRADAKLYPASRPDAAVELSISMTLHRTAVGRGLVRLDAPGQGVIRIVPAARLAPVEVVLTTQAAGSGDAAWSLGGITLPREVHIPLNPCRRPCRRGDDGAFLIEAFAAVFPQRNIAATSANLSKGVIGARTVFSYGDIYKGLLVDGPRTRFEVDPEEERRIPASFLWPTETVINNATLADEYRRSDADGIGQDIAVERIVGQRRYMLTAILIAIIALAVASVYRRFTPSPFLEAHTLHLDLNAASIPKQVDAATVEIRNTSQAWLRKLQWRRRGPWTLHVERVSAEWASGRQLEGVSTASLLALRPFDQTQGTGNRIGGYGEGRVVLVLDQRELARSLPPPSWNGADETATIRVFLVIQPGQSRNVSLTVRIEPEQPTQPKLDLETVRRDVQWDAEHDLELGSIVLASQASHPLARPALFAYSLSVIRNETPIYIRHGFTEMVPSGERVVVPVIVPRGATPNPAAAEETWILKIAPTGSVSAERLITVRRDVKEVSPKINIDAAGSIAPGLLIWNDEGPIVTFGSSAPAVRGERLRLPGSNSPIRIGGDTLDLCTLEVSHAVPELRGQFQVTAQATLAVADKTLAIPLKDTRGELSSQRLVRANETLAVTGKLSEDLLYSILQDGHARQKEATLTIHIVAVVPAGNSPAKRTVLIEVPLLLEREERGSILAIDLGNSAIAIGTLISGGFGGPVFHMTDCQSAVIRGSDRTLRELDPANAERKSELLPSAFCVEFDKRTHEISSLNGKPGTHWSRPPTEFSGCDPQILSLPALSDHYSAYPQRIVRSIKHLLGSDYTSMDLLDALMTKQGAVDVLEVDELLAAVLTAVARTYANGVNFERVVHTVPNTFAGWQLERATRAIRAAFPNAIAEWVRPLRESDAVMHHYLDRHGEQSGSSVVLFYDFGSGTIDLTLARIAWEKEKEKHEATILARIGLDRAGSYLDRLLAECIHGHLDAAANQDRLLYRYPLFGDGATGPEPESALAYFRQRLGDAKREWKFGDTLKISQSRDAYSLVSNEKWKLMANAGMGVSGDPDNHALLVAWEAIQNDPGITEFLLFVRTELIYECLRLGNVSAGALTRIVLSGRGALWPGFTGLVKDTFPKADITMMMEDDPAAMKTVVVRGAAAWMRNRDRLVVQETLPLPTYVAFIDLDEKRGHWARMVVLKDDYLPVGAGELSIARIDFALDAARVNDRMRHPLWSRLIRPYPGTRQCRPGTEVKVERSPDGKDTIVLRESRAKHTISRQDKRWSVGEWSYSSEFGS